MMIGDLCVGEAPVGAETLSDFEQRPTSVYEIVAFASGQWVSVRKRSLSQGVE